MKFVFLIIAAMFSLPALASAPQVGDQAVYDVTTPGATTQYVRSIIEYSSVSQSYLVDFYQVGSPQGTHSTTWLTAAALEGNERFISDCTGSGGKTVPVTVPAGSFNACEIPADGDVIVDLADVPFYLTHSLKPHAVGPPDEWKLHSFTRGSGMPQ